MCVRACACARVRVCACALAFEHAPVGRWGVPVRTPAAAGMTCVCICVCMRIYLCGVHLHVCLPLLILYVCIWVSNCVFLHMCMRETESDTLKVKYDVCSIGCHESEGVARS